jgi:hypothetical protein
MKTKISSTFHLVETSINISINISIPIREMDFGCARFICGEARLVFSREYFWIGSSVPELDAWQGFDP